jgi:hypothetical protein
LDGKPVAALGVHAVRLVLATLLGVYGTRQTGEADQSQNS